MKNLILMLFSLCLLSLVSCGRPRTETITVQDGKPGTNCGVEQTSYGAEIECEDGTGATLYHGDAGVGCDIQNAAQGALITCGDQSQIIYDGEDAELTSDTIVETIDPCGDDPNNFDEVILKTYGGDLVAYFEKSGKRFLTVLEPGSYKTTDKQKCEFVIEADYSITY